MLALDGAGGFECRCDRPGVALEAFELGSHKRG